MNTKNKALIALAGIGAAGILGFYLYNKVQGLSFGQAIGKGIASTTLAIPQEIISYAQQQGALEAQQLVVNSLNNQPLTPQEKAMGWATPPVYTINNPQAFNAWQQASAGMPNGQNVISATLNNFGENVASELGSLIKASPIGGLLG